MEQSAYQEMARVQDTHWWFCTRRHILETVLKRLSLPKQPKIVEIGCGTGANLGMLKKFAGTLIGVEPGEYPRTQALLKHDVVLNGALPDTLPSECRDADVVLALDVLEHVVEDAASLSAMAGLLKPGGALILTVPAHPWLWSAHDVANHHHRRYRRKDFAAMLSATGLSVTLLSYYNFWLFPVVVLKRVLDKIRGVNEGSDLAMPAPMVNKALYHIFSSERVLLGRLALPFGVSLIAVLRKPH
ncbi:MAG: class I SAM-dependent methyltransferase [Alphaproteobacteria bacterium]|jgi:SAM-dependent methyltransferase|nr:class I SAM-dependent methyltransferase [Thalassospira sp.]MCE2964326.1 class I SAM-dependent methyltransferase [Alphaproteobacteria bacterium]